jgi:mRNA interferase YafQ
MSDLSAASSPTPAYRVKQTSQYRKDLKRLIRQGKNMDLLGEVVNTLIAGKTLDAKYRDHALGNNWKGFRDCHIEPDWVLVYKKDNDILVLTLTRSGSHSELML